MKLKRGTYKEIGKHFLTMASISLSVGLLTPLLKEEEIKLSALIGIALWIALFFLGVYFINRGEENG